jgi:hypothetical protein
MNCALFDEYIKAVYDDKTWPNHMKPGVLCWAIAEQGERRHEANGMGELARNADNYHSLHQRKEMAIYYPNTYHLENTTEVDNNYVWFASPQQEIEGLKRFLQRPYYVGFENHMNTFEELLRFITPAFCPTVGYVEKVLSFIPEAEAELRKVGWEDNMGVGYIHKLLMEHRDSLPFEPEPINEYSVNNGLLYYNGEPVPFFDTPYYDKWVKNEPKDFLFHFTANDNFEGQCKYFQKNAPEVSPHLLIGEVGQVAQFVPFHRPAWHSGSAKWNRRTIGVEIVNLGCSQKTLLGNVLFIKWNGIRHIPMTKCLYAPHKYEPNTWRWWQEFTDAEYEAIKKIMPPIRAEFEPTFGKMGMRGHEEVCYGKVDPGPNFDWDRIR